MWFEIVFIELCAKSFSVYARTGGVDNKGTELPKLVETVSAPLTWREVVKFVRRHEWPKFIPVSRLTLRYLGSNLGRKT
jgi:hypothetical protein